MLANNGAIELAVDAHGGAGSGSSGLANGFASGQTGTVTVTASAARMTAGLTGILVQSVDASTSNALQGSGTVADQATDLALATFAVAAPGGTLNQQGVAPVASDISSILAANSAIAKAFAVSPSYFALAEPGGGYSPAGTGSETTTSTVDLTVDPAQLAVEGDLLVGLYDGKLTGSGISGVTLTNAAHGTTVLSDSLASAAAAQAFFTNDAVGSAFYGALIVGDPYKTLSDSGVAGATIDGSGGNVALDATANGDTLRAGRNDRIQLAGGWDQIVFGSRITSVSGFVASGVGHDTLAFDRSVFSDWAHLLGATKQQGSDLAITIDPTDTVLLKNVALAAFSAAEAKFV